MAQRSIYRFIDLNPEYEALAALKPLSAYTGVLRTLGDASVLAEEYLETQAVRAIYDCVKQRDPAFKFVEPSSAPQNDMSWLIVSVLSILLSWMGQLILSGILPSERNRDDQITQAWPCEELAWFAR
ncbi:hypothetical protein CIHG_02422 [Coccidioides immitis H538.4]|uniref:Uncharacterized protein n=3 Tax=Coccidioides immitis TaxID=5501 RepID=A0A0J8R9B9_COCIT|nr:hypothetical protein CIRG_00584 [Coccidioides immitis RMSCC 2394]KMU81634.1 hypothetical protein CISG_09247 [Coccidioides immitis RMSCC 3703]KMU84636.1 hypothetical protein CIHG_02422 [Coccidioides immitis H538.4]